MFSFSKVPPSASPSSQHRTITRIEECLDIGEGPSPKDWCPSYHTCHACAAIPGCTWDIDKNSRYESIIWKIIYCLNPIFQYPLSLCSLFFPNSIFAITFHKMGSLEAGESTKSFLISLSKQYLCNNFSLGTRENKHSLGASQATPQFPILSVSHPINSNDLSIISPLKRYQ